MLILGLVRLDLHCMVSKGIRLGQGLEILGEKGEDFYIRNLCI